MADSREVTPDELAAAVELIRSGALTRPAERARAERLQFRSIAEVLQALDRSVIDKAEARRAIGYPKRRQPKQLAAANKRRGRRKKS